MRKYPRYFPGDDQRVTAELSVSGMTFRGVLRNISLGGVMIKASGTPTMLDTPVFAEGVIRFGERVMHFSCAVVHIHHGLTGALLGCRFDQPATTELADVIETFIDGYSAGAVHSGTSALGVRVVRVLGFLSSHLQRDWDACLRDGVRHIDLRGCSGMNSSGQLMVGTAIAFGLRVLGCSVPARWSLAEVGIPILQEQMGGDPCEVSSFKV